MADRGGDELGIVNNAVTPCLPCQWFLVVYLVVLGPVPSLFILDLFPFYPPFHNPKLTPLYHLSNMVSTRASSRAASAIPDAGPPPQVASSSSASPPPSALPNPSPLPPTTPRRRTTAATKNTTTARRRRRAAPAPKTPETPTTDSEREHVKAEDVEEDLAKHEAIAKLEAIAKHEPAEEPRHAPLAWSHAPSALTLFWLAIALPLVIWDTVYMLGRPHTFEGGVLHWPLYVPYRLYAQVDHVYSRRAWDANSGFSGAQSALNAVETLVYFAYLYLFFARRDAPAAGAGNARRSISGKDGALTVLVGFSGALMTLSKTVLYCT